METNIAARGDSFIKSAYTAYGFAFGVATGFELPHVGDPQPYPPGPMFVAVVIFGLILHAIGRRRKASE